MNEEKIQCDDCGTTEDVKETLCPYALDVANEEVPAMLCDHCYSERAADI